MKTLYRKHADHLLIALYLAVAAASTALVPTVILLRIPALM